MCTGLVHLVRIVHVLLGLFLFLQKPDTPKASGKASVAYVCYLSIHLHSFPFLFLLMLCLKSTIQRVLDFQGTLFDFLAVPDVLA